MVIKYDANGLIPAVIQDNETVEVLMIAWVKAISFNLKRETGVVYFWNRNRKRLWSKGDTVC